MQTEIGTAVEILRDSPNLTDEEVYQTLLKKGIERRLAARLVEFIPASYCRVILAPTGARFADTFQRHRKDGTTTSPAPLASEPVWVAALEYARREIAKGIPREEKLALAGRSAEFRTANDLFHNGSKLQNIVFALRCIYGRMRGPRSSSPRWNFGFRFRRV